MGKGYWDDSPRFFGDSFGALMSKTMFTAVHPEEDRYLSIREMAHLMGLPHDFEIENVKNFNQIAQVRYVHSISRYYFKPNRSSYILMTQKNSQFEVET